MINSAVGIILRHLASGSEVLLVKRKQEDRTYPDAWCLPGGKCDKDETLEDCVKREIFEEIGLNVRSSMQWYFRENDKFKIHFFSIAVENTDVKLNEDELESFWWFNFHELPETLLPLTKEVLNNIKEYHHL